MGFGTGMVPCRVVYGLAVHKGVQVEDSELYLEDVAVVVVVHMEVETVRGGLGRGMGRERDRYDGTADGGVEGLEMGGYDGSVGRVEEERERGRVTHKVILACGDDGDGVACSGGRRVPRMEHGQGMELRPRRASRRRVESLYGTLPRIQCLSPSCTSSHIFPPNCWCIAALALLV